MYFILTKRLYLELNTSLVLVLDRKSGRFTDCIWDISTRGYTLWKHPPSICNLISFELWPDDLQYNGLSNATKGATSQTLRELVTKLMGKLTITIQMLHIIIMLCWWHTAVYTIPTWKTALTAIYFKHHFSQCLLKHVLIQAEAVILFYAYLCGTSSKHFDSTPNIWAVDSLLLPSFIQLAT